MTCRDRLSASDMLQVRKVIEHLYEKVIGQGSDGGSQTTGSASANVSSSHVEKADRDDDPVSYTHLTLPTNREV